MIYFPFSSVLRQRLAITFNACILARKCKPDCQHSHKSVRINFRVCFFLFKWKVKLLPLCSFQCEITGLKIKKLELAFFYRTLEEQSSRPTGIRKNCENFMEKQSFLKNMMYNLTCLCIKGVTRFYSNKIHLDVCGLISVSFVKFVCLRTHL